MSIKKSLESSFSLTFALYAAFFISFVYSIILVRVVSVEVMGMIGMGGTFIEITALVSTLGSISVIQTYTTYYISRNEFGHLKYILKKSSVMCLGIASAISVITFLFSREISLLLYNTDVMDLPLRVISVFIVANIVLKILDSVIRASKQFTLYGTIQILSTALKLLLTLFFIYILLRYFSGNDDVLVAGSFIASIIVTLCCIILILLRNRAGMRKILSVESVKPTQEKILKFGASTATLELISVWGVYINALAVGFFLPPEEWGYYSVAVIIMSVVTVFKTVLNVIAYPALVDAHSKGDAGEFSLTIHIMFKYWTLFFVPLIAAFILFLPYALPVIWGPAYEKSVLIAQILLAGFLIQYYSSIYLSSLTAIEKPHKQFTPTLINVVLCIVFGVSLVYLWGILGAAITVFITSVIQFFVSRYIFTSEHNIIDTNSRRKFAYNLIGTVTIQLVILILLYIPSWFILESITHDYLRFIIAGVCGLILSLISISFIFGRNKLSNEEIEKVFLMFPISLHSTLIKLKSLSMKIWRGN